MESSYDIVVIGDICLDWYCVQSLPFPFSNLSNGKDEWLPIRELPGGSGLLFATFAQDVGYKPFLLGKVGDDAAGNHIYKWLQNRGLNVGINVVPTKSTGKVFIINDSSGKRLLIATSESADRWLSVSDIQKHAEVITASRLLYVSGHCFKEPGAPRTEAARQAIDIARKTGAWIAFDLVPHEFYKIYPEFTQFQSLTEGVNILISEVSTIRRILKMGKQHEKITKSIIEETIENISKHFNNLILRYGPHGTNYQVIWDSRNQRIIWQETDYVEVQDKRGYGDKLTIKVFHDIWGI